MDLGIVNQASLGPESGNCLAIHRGRRAVHLINFDEPFGLSTIEAMACGTPVDRPNETSIG